MPGEYVCESNGCEAIIPTHDEMIEALQVPLEESFRFNRDILAMTDDGRRIRAKSLLREAMVLIAQLGSFGRTQSPSLEQQFLQRLTEAAIDQIDPGELLTMLPFMHQFVVTRRQVFELIIKKQEQAK